MSVTSSIVVSGLLWTYFIHLFLSLPFPFSFMAFLEKPWTILTCSRNYFIFLDAMQFSQAQLVIYGCQACLSKGLGAPVGSVIVGSKSFITRVWIYILLCHVFQLWQVMLIQNFFQAKRLRKTLGGGMRQVGVLCAAAYVALKENAGRLQDDHRRAKVFAGLFYFSCYSSTFIDYKCHDPHSGLVWASKIWWLFLFQSKLLFELVGKMNPVRLISWFPSSSHDKCFLFLFGRWIESNQRSKSGHIFSGDKYC